MHWPTRPWPVGSWSMQELLQHIDEIAVLFHSDIVYGDSRACAELQSRFDLVVAEVVRRIDADDWGPTEE